YEKFYQANVIATQNIITACLENNIKRLVYISTPSIYADYTDKFSIQENSILPEVFINNYAKTKKIAEDLIQQAFCKKKLPVITLRPRGLFGPYDQTIMPRIIRAGVEGRVPLINNGEALLDITYIDNVVDAIILAMNADNKYLGNVYNITNGEPVKLIELLTKIFKRLDIRLKTIKLPFLASYYYAYLLEIISKLKFGKPEPRLTRYSVAVLGCSQTLDITAARRDLGYIPRITISEGIDRYVDWFKTHKDC
ncbi:MAG: NAD-dependent epimerase/dehydratase family protein, partial [Gammaproteobacteria bacterium]|nr:NAD-dependent epimerase/dehydratase family protein [Gammaproteobacteria bacterium]